jgi:hypothetical protein
MKRQHDQVDFEDLCLAHVVTPREAASLACVSSQERIDYEHYGRVVAERMKRRDSVTYEEESWNVVNTKTREAIVGVIRTLHTSKLRLVRSLKRLSEGEENARSY